MHQVQPLASQGRAKNDSSLKLWRTADYQCQQYCASRTNGLFGIRQLPTSLWVMLLIGVGTKYTLLLSNLSGEAECYQWSMELLLVGICDSPPPMGGKTLSTQSLSPSSKVEAESPHDSDCSGGHVF